MNRFRINWIDFRRSAQQQPNPAYPKGKDIDGSAGRSPTCVCKLPYPAKRCGIYQIECSTCRISVAITTAGRVDDPRSVKLACKPRQVAK